MPPDKVAIWFVILALSVIGLNGFVVSAIARDVPIAATYRGVLPFVGADVIRLAILTLFPGISLLLVRWLN